MARSNRIQFKNAFYHVMNRGLRKRPIFHSDGDKHHFLKLLEQTSMKHKVKVLAYCLMGNHYHILMQTPEADLSSSMKFIGHAYTQGFNRRNGFDGPLFRGRFKAILVEKDSYLLQVIRYIHLNPVSAKIVDRAESYRWSSHRHYLNEQAKPEWLTTEPILSYFHTNHSNHHFQEFVAAGVRDEIYEFYNRQRVPAILGSEEFKEGCSNLVS